MKPIITLIGVVLIALGILGFSYKYYTYTQNEKVAQIGSLKVTADQEKTVFISPLLSGVTFGVGIVFVLVGMSRKPD